MFNNFTDSGLQVMRRAQQEARRFNHEYIGTEHMLLGMCASGDLIIEYLLRQFGVGLDDVRAKLEAAIAPGEPMVTMGLFPRTPRAKRAIELAEAEVVRLKLKRVSSQMLLIGLLQETEGVASVVLTQFGLTAADMQHAMETFVADWDAGKLELVKRE